MAHSAGLAGLVGVGSGNLAWHMVRTCGRESPSATFQPMVIQPDL